MMLVKGPSKEILRNIRRANALRMKARRQRSARYVRPDGPFNSIRGLWEVKL